MDDRVLVVYGSRHGATAEIAERIGQVLRETGLHVDVLRADQAGDPGPYRAVVLGSAAYIGRWRKEAARFLRAHEAVLAQKPVWVFTEKWMIRNVKAATGDFRNWEGITAWAQGIAAELKGKGADGQTRAG